MTKEELDVLKQRLRKRIELPYPANIAEAVNLSNELQTVIKELEQAQAEKEEINKAYHDMNHQVHKLTYEKMELQAEIKLLHGLLQSGGKTLYETDAKLLDLEAENIRYRQALEDIIKTRSNPELSEHQRFDRIVSLANCALEGSE